MSSNRLKLNAEKTLFIWFGTRQQLAKVTVSPLQVKDQLITPLDKVRDLGIIIDGELSMDQHVRNVIRDCFYQLRQLQSVRRSLTIDARRTLAAAFVATRVDYCNAVLYDASTLVTRRLHMVAGAKRRRPSGCRVRPRHSGPS